jgi:predicted nuclease of predicted toxin-antitoxin system
MEKAQDVEILDRARSEERICVTLDHDFHAHLAESGGGRPSVVFLRVQSMDAAGQAELIRSICVKYAEALRDGAAISADRERARVRRLPLR